MASKLISTSRSTIRVMRDRLRCISTPGPTLWASRSLGAGTMRFLAHEGIVGISVGYRRSTKKGLDGSVDDAARALAWVGSTPRK